MQPEQMRDILGVPFSEEQLTAITAPLEPGVIIAGAGTGKTTVMAARVVWLVVTGAVQPDEVLGLTFTRKAAGELAQRIAAALEAAGVRAELADESHEVVSTYDSFAARLVGEFGLRLGFEAEPRMLSGAGRYRLADRVVAERRDPLQHLTRLRHTSIPQLILDLDAQLQSHLVTPETLRKFSARAMADFMAAPVKRDGGIYKDIADTLATVDERLELLELVTAYQELKAELGYLEHADQLRRAVELVEQVPAVGAVLRSRFRVVLLDEYQDTSAAQVRLLHGLFSGPEPQLGQGFPVTAVGDPHQAIYGWRGAAATNILGFREHFLCADGNPGLGFELRINRRSDAAILRAGNALAADLHSAGAAGVELLAPDEAADGEVAAYGYNTFDEELDALVQRVIDVHDAGGAWSDIAVLTRTNYLVSQVFAALRERDVPAEISGLGGLVRLPEVAPVVAMLRILAGDCANADVVNLLSGPRWNLGLSDLEALAARASHLAGARRETPATSTLAELLQEVVAGRDPLDVPSLLEAAMDPGGGISGEGRTRLREFTAVVDELRRHRSDPAVELVRRIITCLGAEIELRLGSGRAEQLHAFVSHVADYSSGEGDETLSGLVSWLDAEDDFGEGLEQAGVTGADSVKLMTVHRAKGLEWESVFTPGWGEGQFPSLDRTGMWPTRSSVLPAPLRGDADGIPQLQDYSSAGLKEYKAALNGEHLAAETRLAYVAATRARSLLVASGHVWSPGNKRPRRLSRFLTAVGDVGEGVEQVTAVTEDNPVPVGSQVAAWPVVRDPAETDAMGEASRLVEQARELIGQGGDTDAWVWDAGVSDPEAARLAQSWDDDEAAISARESGVARRRVVLPEGLSATMMIALKSDPGQFARQLARPMPRQPSRSATRGSHFHAWVQQRFELPPSFEELDTTPVTSELRPLIEAFERGRFADRAPLGAEVPFLLRWGPHILRGRIDAVYQWPEGPFRELVVDWKTSSAASDPLQLAIYRLAWAEARNLPLEDVGAGFYHVMGDDLRLVDAPVSLIRDAMATTGDETWNSGQDAPDWIG